MDWHSSSCRPLELEWSNGLPRCRRCGSKASKDPTSPQNPRPPAPTTKGDRIACPWPQWPVPVCDQGHNEHVDSPIKPHASCVCSSTQRKEDSPTLRIFRNNVEASSSVEKRHSIYRDVGKFEIRIMCLHGAESFDAPIHCSLNVIDLSSCTAPLFEALSYTWADENGDSSRCKTIYIGPDYYILPVTANCEAALRRFRENRDRLLWCDAVCINQDNGSERNHQVSIMSMIYSEASRVLAYLGEPVNDDNSVMDFLDGRGQKGERPSTDELQLIYTRPYFTRVWVIQEIALARRATFTYGPKAVSLKSFQGGLGCFNGQFSNWLAIAGKNSDGENPDHLFQLLARTWHCLSSDPRDKVFSLLSLVGLAPNYTLSTQEVYTGIAAYLLSHMSSPGKLLEYSVRPKKISHLPSWVTDWSHYVDLSKDSILNVNVIWALSRSIVSPDMMSYHYTISRERQADNDMTHKFIDEILRTIEKLSLHPECTCSQVIRWKRLSRYCSAKEASIQILAKTSRLQVKSRRILAIDPRGKVKIGSESTYFKCTGFSDLKGLEGKELHLIPGSQDLFILRSVRGDTYSLVSRARLVALIPGGFTQTINCEEIDLFFRTMPQSNFDVETIEWYRFEVGFTYFNEHLFRLWDIEMELLRRRGEELDKEQEARKPHFIYQWLVSALTMWTAQENLSDICNIEPESDLISRKIDRYMELEQLQRECVNIVGCHDLSSKNSNHRDATPPQKFASGYELRKTLYRTIEDGIDDNFDRFSSIKDEMTKRWMSHCQKPEKEAIAHEIATINSLLARLKDRGSFSKVLTDFQKSNWDFLWVPSTRGMSGPNWRRTLQSVLPALESNIVNSHHTWEMNRIRIRRWVATLDLIVNIQESLFLYTAWYRMCDAAADECLIQIE